MQSKNLAFLINFSKLRDAIASLVRRRKGCADIDPDKQIQARGLSLEQKRLVRSFRFVGGTSFASFIFMSVMILW
eukprot:m.375612 g.375612  ORF g.375612 m.375612 type:complete len:75 (-) comp56181_c0_seq5:840-1064(-)